MSRADGLAVLVKRFPRLSETFVLSEFLELRRQGVPATLFAISDPGEPVVQPEAEAVRPEVTYLRDRPGRLRAMARALRRHPGGAAAAVRFALGRRSRATWRHLGEALVLVDALDARGITRLHAHFAHGPAAVAYLAHVVGGVEFSFTAHAKDLYTTPPAYVASRAAAARFVATCTTANAEYLVRRLGVDPDKVVVTRHGVDLERFGAVRRSSSGRRILAVGRLVPKKGLDVLVRACAVLARSGADFECVVIGGGPEEAALRELIDRLGVGPFMRLAGARPQPELVDEYAGADVFVLPCRVLPDGDRDGVPNVVMEAMAAGLPVVATSVSGLPEVVTDGVTGVLVPPEDPVRLAGAIGAILDDPAEGTAMGLRGRTRALDEFRWDRCIAGLIDALDGRVATPAPGSPAAGPATAVGAGS
ncbi:MAG TPA: glycosyltransferase [Acidimicrobiales bacterium]|nr:glycosyltransferase [Acidimicrobiales bacterium]